MFEKTLKKVTMRRTQATVERISSRFLRLTVVVLLYIAAHPADAADAKGGPKNSGGKTVTEDAPYVRFADCDIYLIDRVELAAVEAGPLAKLSVQAGWHVKKGESLAALDDKQATLAAKAAQRQWEMAVVQSNSHVDVEFAKKSERVAYAEWQRVQSIENVVTPAERASVRFEWEKAKLQIEKAELDAQAAKLTAEIRQAELEQALEAKARRSLICPFDGVVLETKHQPGEWIAMGEGIVTVARMDRLRLKTYVKAESIPRRQLSSREGVVQVSLAAERTEEFFGRVSFVSPVVDADGRFEVWFDIENRIEDGEWLLAHGLRGDLTLQAGKALGKEVNARASK